MIMYQTIQGNIVSFYIYDIVLHYIVQYVII